MSRNVYVIGVGMSPFVPPKKKNWNYPDMAKISGENALADAGNMAYSRVDAVVASYCYGEPTSGQRAVYELGLSGVPVFNVNNNCSSGSSALMLARHLIQSGQYQCVMAIGFEKMEGGLSAKYMDHTSPVDRHFKRITQLGADPRILPGMNEMTSEVIRMFALAAVEYMKRWPSAVKPIDFARIAAKNRRHGRQNPNACFYRAPLLDVDQAMTNRMMCYPITVHQSSMTADGSACAILCSESFRNSLPSDQQRNRAVEIVSQRMCSDFPNSFNGGYKELCGYAMSKRAAELAYRDAGLSAGQVDVVEVHDCFSCNEAMMYEAMGLAAEGGAARLFNSGQWVKNSNGGEIYRMGKWVVNPSGGLEAKGHPIGATGIAQCHELVSQLRGEAARRQVDGALVGLQHNFGIGGAAVVTIYRRSSDRRNQANDERAKSKL